MEDMEIYFLVFIGILAICLIISVLLFKKNIGGQFGFKCVPTNNPGVTTCVKVNQAPSVANNIFSNALACQQSCGYPTNGLLKSFTCDKSKNVCNRTTNEVDVKNGFYPNAVDCNLKCNPVK